MSDIIGITMGDPAGVGPEISVKALAGMTPADKARTRIYGNRTTLEAAKATVGAEVDLDGHVIDLPVEGAPCPRASCRPSPATPPSASSKRPCAMPRLASSVAS